MVLWTMWCVALTHHATHKLINWMGGRTSNMRGMRDMHDTHTFFIAKNSPKYRKCFKFDMLSTGGTSSVQIADHQATAMANADRPL